jgi:hypothetical protein
MYKKVMPCLIAVVMAASLCGCVEMSPATVTTTETQVVHGDITATIPVTKTVLSVATSEVTTTATVYGTNSVNTPEIVTRTYSLKPDEQSASFSVYLTKGKTLHLYWSITEGEYFRLLCITPKGIELYVQNDSTFDFPGAGRIDSYGHIEFSPTLVPVSSNQDNPPRRTTVDLGEGYYVFNPLLLDYDTPVVVEFQYWVEG